MGQPRIFFSMARDGLLPAKFASVHPRFRTPHVTTILTGVVVGTIAAVSNIDEMVDLTNIGTLFAFILVCIGIPILRIKDADRRRPFRVPFGPWLLPILGAVSCLGLIWYLPQASWWRFVGWLLLGLAVYAGFGYSRSLIGKSLGRPTRTPFCLKAASLGCLLMAAGMFTIPHGAGPSQLVSALFSAAADGHGRVLTGFALASAGLAMVYFGWQSEFKRRNAET
jgi:APA family basic amino acid/polyamine antiporter